MSSKLGFGGMRLPLVDPNDCRSIDSAELVRMVDRFLESGGRSFDTAWTYHDGAAEEALRRALVERYPRDRYRLTDKLPTLLIESEEQQERIFAEQLERCGVAFFDRYLVHCATAAFYAKAERFDSIGFALRKRREGLVREVGFSYHDSPELLERILTRYPEVDFVQLQISYVDWENTPIRARACYETARRHGKPIVGLCPLKGGLLAEVPAEVERLFRSVRPELPAAAWALRFAASLEGVDTVLSGMSSAEQVAENAAWLHDAEALTEAERAAIDRATAVICRTAPIQCTGCGYCVPACPQGIPIPTDLRLYNAHTEAEGIGLAARMAQYEAEAAAGGRASACLGCGNCEGACPQHLRIVDWLRRVSELFEPQAVRA